MRGTKTSRIALGLGAAFFALLIVYGCQFLYRSISVLDMKSDPGFTVFQVGSRVMVLETISPEARAQLRIRDEVLSIDGTELTSSYDVPQTFRRVASDTAFSVNIKRGDRVFSVILSSHQIPISNWVISGVARLIIPQIFLIAGLAVFLLKPHDKQARLLALMFGMFIGAIMAISPSYSGEPGWMVAVMLIIHLASLFLWPVFFHFFLIFPEPSPIVKRVPQLERWLYVPHLLTIFPYFALINVVAVFAPEQVLDFQRRFSLFASASIIVAICYITAGLLSLLVNYRQAGRPSRRRMRVVVAGSLAGFLPMFLLIALAIAFNLPRTYPAVAYWLGVAALFAFPLFPLSFVYAIVRHQVIPVRLILRRSVRYLLVSRGFVIVQTVAVFLVLSFLLTGKRLELIDSFGARADIVVTMAATAMAIALLTLINQRVMPIIDRRFFREAYDAQQVLSDLALAVRRATTTRQVIDRAAAKIHDALHVASIAIFLRGGSSADYVCSLASYFAEDGSSTDDTSGLVLNSEGAICKRLRQAFLIHTVDFDQPRSWLANLEADAAGGAAATERSVLLRLKSVLLVPVATKDELLGVISLGPRLGDLPYSREDKQLLTAISWQLAFAVQNARLIEEAAEEEKLRHELAIATNVQRRLFPERPPVFAGIELAGICQPALGVGGDYYDFIVLDDHKVGVAVADVAGKGISAALLMSTVQASLRSQAPSVNGNLVELATSMNRLLHGSTDGSSYATFFYAQFDEINRSLTYVNAGHNPPMLVSTRREVVKRKAFSAAGSASGEGLDPVSSLKHSGPIEVGDTEIRRLTRGGPLIGAFDDCVYEQHCLQVNAGDLLVAYTDGVTEAVNSYDEEFGEDRLRSLVASSVDLTADGLAQHILAQVREWCAGRPLQDDLTLVVMKVK